MKKLKLFLDFDNTIVNTNEVAVSYFNKMFGKTYSLTDLKTYNFTDLFPNITNQNIEEFFDGKYLFDNIVTIENSKQIISKMFKKFEISIVSLCSKENKIKKVAWAYRNFPYFDNFFAVELSENMVDYNSRWAEQKIAKWKPHDKSSVDMSGGIFIDDHIDCLRSSNAKVKILYRFNQDGDWNEFDNTDEIYVVNTWSEIEEILNFYIRQGEVV